MLSVIYAKDEELAESKIGVGRRTAAAGSQMAVVQVRIRQRTDGIRVSDELDLIVVIGQQGSDVKHG